MTWLLAWHRAPGMAISTDALVLSSQEVQAFGQVGELVQALSAQLAGEADRIEQARTRACEAGWQAGWAAGLEEARTQATRDLAHTLQGLARQAQAEHQALQEAVLTLSLLVIQRMACGLAPEVVLSALLRQALAQQLPPGPLTIRLHSGVLDGVRSRWEQEGIETSCDWRADDALGLLDCVIETPAGRLLAGLPAQIDRTDALLRTALARHAGAPAPARAAKQVLQETEAP